jgi:tetratricopeptide (TPR) repeat protein
MQNDNVRRLTRWFPLLILAAAVVAYANSFQGPFIFDDARVVTSNPHLYTLWPPWKAVLVPTRWVADLSFAVNFALSDMTAADYRISNVLIHVLGGWLLFGLVKRTLMLPRFSGRFNHSAAPLSLAVALLWVVHPLQTESVTYIAQRIEALMGLFYLLVFYCFVRGLTAAHPRRWMNAAVAACAIGMGTKEVMVTLPVMLFLYDGVFAASSWRDVLRARWKVHVAMVLTLGIFALLFLMGMGLALDEGGLFEQGISPWRYALTQTGVILHYLRLSFVPTSLCLSYRWPFAQSLGEVWRPALAIAGLLGVTLWGLLRRKPFAFPLAWLFVILAPTSSIMPIADAAFEHRMYLPLAGVLALAVIGGYALLERLAAGFRRRAAWQTVFGVTLALVAVGFVFLTRARNLDYRSEEVVWRDIIRKRPLNFKPYVALSGALIRDGRLDEANGLLTNFIARLPDLSTVPFEELQRRYRLDPNLPCVEYAMAHNNLGLVYFNREQLEEAAAMFREALRVFPANHIGYFNLGRVAVSQGRTNEAIGWWQAALQRQPDSLDTLTHLAIHYAARADYTNAVRSYREALRLKPDHPFVRAQTAWLLATCPDDQVRNGREAVALAQALPEMSGGSSARAYDIWAAALAEAGRFDEAVFCAEHALGLAPQSTDIEQRLKLYRQQQPYHESR